MHNAPSNSMYRQCVLLVFNNSIVDTCTIDIIIMSIVRKYGSFCSLELRLDFKLLFLAYSCNNIAEGAAISEKQIYYIFTFTSHRHGHRGLALSLPLVSSSYGRLSISFLAAARWILIMEPASI